MFYVNTHLPNNNWLLHNFETDEKQEVTIEEMKARVIAGEEIAGFKYNIERDSWLMVPEYLKGKFSLHRYAILSNKQYLIEEFNRGKNGIRPESVPHSSHKKYKWVCDEGHEYEAQPASRCRKSQKGSGCPYCASKKIIQGYNDLATYCKQHNIGYLLDEWDYEKNELKPTMVAPKSHKKVWWKCLNRGHIYEAYINSRVMRLDGCPKCSNKTSFPEQAIKFYLEQVELLVEDRSRPYRGYEIDVYLPDFKLGIEYDGVAYHSDDMRVEYDEKKNKFLFDGGIHLIRLREEGCPQLELYGSEVIVVSDLDSAINQLLHRVQELTGIDLSDISIDSKRDRLSILEGYRASQKERSFRYDYPEVAREWHPLKNGGLKPEMFSAGSNEKVWWLCHYCGKEWVTSIEKRCKKGSGTCCPACQKLYRQPVRGRRFIEEFPELIPFLRDTVEDLDKLPMSTDKTLKIKCPQCDFTEPRRCLYDQIRGQNGLACSNCGYYVAVSKYDNEKLRMLPKSKSCE